MSLFEKKGYHKLSKEKSKTYLDKALGLTAVAGLVATAAYSVRPLAATAAFSFARNSFLKTAATAAESVSSELFSNSFNTASSFAQELNKTIATQASHTVRANSFISSLKAHITPVANKSAEDLIEANKTRLFQMVNRLARAKNTSEINATFLTKKSMDEFETQASKLGIKFDFLNSQDRELHFRLYAEKAYKASAQERFAIEHVINDPENVKTFLAFAKKAKASEERKLNRAIRVLGLNKGQIIKGADLEKEEISKVLNQMLSKTSQTDQNTLTTDSILKHLNDSLEKSFTYRTVDGGEEVHTELLKEFQKLRQEADTGLRLIHKPNGSVDIISIPHLLKTVKSNSFRFLEDIQMPLVPGLFQPRIGKMFTSILPSSELFKNLREVTNHPELMRLLGKEVSATDHLLGVGDLILKVDQNMHLKELEGGFSIFEKTSTLLSTVSDVRGLAPESFLKDNNPLKTIISGEHMIGGSKKKSKLYKTAMANHHLYSQYGYSEAEGFTVQALDPVLTPVYESLFGLKATPEGILGGVDIRDLNPVKLAELLKRTDTSKINPNQYVAAVEHIVSEGTKGGSSISNFLKTTVLDWARSGNVGHFLGDDEDWFIQQALSKIDKPDEIIALLKRTGGKMKSPIVSQTSRLNQSSNPIFTKTINALGRDPEALLDVRENEGSAIERAASRFLGATGLSTMSENLEEGLLGEVLHAKGKERVYDLFNAIPGDPQSLINNLVENIKGTAERSEKIQEALGRLNIAPGGEALFLDKLLKTSSQGLVLHEQNVASMGSILLSQEGLFDEVNGVKERAKIAKVLLNDLDILNIEDTEEFAIGTKSRHSKILKNIYDDSKVADAVAQRFAGRVYHPEDQLYDPFSDTRHYVTVKNGLNGFFKGLVDPNAPLGPGGAIFQGLMQRPQTIGDMAGLGLPGQDLITVGRSMLGFYGKRVLPLFAAYEAYKDLNANLHQIGLNGLDDWGANLIGNIQLTGSQINDSLGLTQFEKKLTHLIPGLDNYLHPRDEQEQREYLLYGDEEIRQGRYWLIGSRDAFHGGRVSYMRPNYYRRWHSHWTEASNVDYANPAYSWLPSPLHPLAPINLALHPHWWENKHIADRPYRSSGIFSEQSNYNSQGWGDYITINSDGNYNPLTAHLPFTHNPSPYGHVTSIGTFGGNLETKLTGGFAPHTDDGSNNIYPGESTYQQGSEISFGYHKQLKSPLTNNYSHKALEFFRSKSGLYAAPIQLFSDTGNNVYLNQNSHYAHSSTRMLYMSETGGLLGPYSEFFRRFIRPDEQDFNAYSPYINNMPSWLPRKFTTGDPYVRTPAGELNLPGEAFERASTWVRPLRVRGSVIGYSEQEIIKKWLNPTEELDGDEAENIVDFGSRAHLLIQRQLKKMGMLLAAEVPIFDDANNISGTIDAIVKGRDGYEIFDIKTQGGKSWGHTPKKYVEQINTYMAITGIQKAHLAFVNRDNMKQIRIEDFNFDPELWQETLAKVGRARNVIQQAVNRGQISPYESYDLLSRIQILAKVAPNSAEFKKAVDFAQKGGGFGGFEQHVFERSIEEAKKLKENYNLYPYRFNQSYETRYVFVEGISNNGDIITSKGVVKLAGVKFDSQAFIDLDAPQVLSRYGITVGRFVPITVLKGQWNEETMNDVPLKAIVGHANKALINSQYASKDDKDRHPLAEKVINGSSGVSLFEKTIHLDTMFTNKFFRVRTALEQFERGEVYGTDHTNWKHPIRTFVTPTLDSIASKNPIMAAVKGGTIASLLFFGRKNTQLAALVGASIAGGLSISRMIEESRTGEIWKPNRYKKQNDVDEYWDILNYLKYTALTEDAQRKAFWLEGTNIKKLLQGRSRESVGLGPWGTLAVYSNRKAKETMYGIDAATVGLQQALEAIPERHRQIAESIIETGSLKEKQRFYDLLPDPEKRLLGKFLNVNFSDLPQKENLEKFFQSHFLPNTRWKGWDVSVDSNDLKTRSESLEEVDISPPSRTSLAKARDYTKNIEIPMVYSPTAGNIKDKILHILASGGHHGINAGFILRPSDRHQINVEMDITHDDRKEFAQNFQKIL